MPLIVDADGDGQRDVVLTTRFNGTLWDIAPDGALVRTLRRDQWLEGSATAVRRAGTAAPLLAFQESTGRLNLVDLCAQSDAAVDIPGPPVIGTAPCAADLDGDGTSEIICARSNSVVTVLDSSLRPLWLFDAGSPFHSSPAAGPVFTDGAAVYVQCLDGTLHCLAANGMPLWRFRTDHPAPAFPSVADPMIVQLGEKDPCVLVSDRDGWLYAVNAATGDETWRVHAGTCALGNPAVTALDSEEPRHVLVLSERGELRLISATGQLVNHAALPEGRYEPRPLVADVDADNELEVIVAARDWKVIVADLEGRVEETLELEGNVREGLVLADLNGDGLLELIAATECGRLYSFATHATEGWNHPRARGAMDGCAGPIRASAALPRLPVARRRMKPKAALTAPYNREASLGTAVVLLRGVRQADAVVAVVRRGQCIVGAACKPLHGAHFTVPCVRRTPGPLVLDAWCLDAGGQVVAGCTGAPFDTATPKPVRLASPEPFIAALDQCAGAYQMPSRWRLPQVHGRDSWHVVRYMPEHWDAFGLSDEPFIREAIPRIWAPAAEPGNGFAPNHPAWAGIRNDSKPFFIMNDYFRPRQAYSDEAYDAIQAMAGERFLGFTVHEWAYHVWKEDLEPGAISIRTREDATEVLHADFSQLLKMSHGRMYPGQGYCLFHHHAFQWGAPTGYAETGENIPCASLQFAFLRGAARQYSGKPWGAYLSNWFRGSVVDTRYRDGGPGVRWSVPDMASGATCGHSPSLEFRMHMAAHLAGATFVHHESDAHNGCIFLQEGPANTYTLSPFGDALKRWYDYSREYPNRGVPYTPVAFMLDFNHGWRPREPIFGIWPQTRADRSIEAVLGHVFPWGGRLDFERGYLANGPYGDIFDAVTDDASLEALAGYGVLWPLGEVTLDEQAQRALMTYVKQGGILILDSTLADQLPPDFPGARLAKGWSFATQAQTALGAPADAPAPYRYRRMRLAKDVQALAWSEQGDPLLVWRRQGRGVLILSATEHWLDEREQLLPHVPAILELLAGAFLPLRASPDVQMLLNRTENGWVVGLINNNGVTKTPTEPAVIHKDGARECLIHFKDEFPVRFVSRMGKFRWHLRADALHVSLKPGEVAVVELEFPGASP